LYNRPPFISRNHSIWSLNGNLFGFTGSLDFQHRDLKHASVLGFDKQFEDWDLTCFVAGTPIKLANGQTKAIEEIQIGDSVKSFDEEKQEFVNGKVTKIFKKQALSHLQITLSNGELIEVTEEHPFYTSTGWIAAKELKPDSKIKTINRLNYNLNI
jgi:hypothetical protein